MAGKSGTQDWFYHAPRKRSPKAGPKDYPAPSQIPMLSNAILDEDERDETGMMRGWIRETDSKYVKLAKQRGRRDLLQMRERPPPSDEPKPYPRVDWFDHNPEQEPQDVNTVRKVYVPDYMVHEDFNPETYVDEQEANRPPPRRAPFSLHDKIKMNESAVDKKRVKLPEIKGTSRRITKKDISRKDEGKSKGQSRYANIPTNDNQDKPIMSKLLNFGYQHEWYDQREKYYDHQKKIQTQQPSWEVTGANQSNRLTTEYRDEINVGGGKMETARGQGSLGNKRVALNKKTQAIMQKTRQEPKEKGLFKMSKFEKVGPRITSHWSEGPRLSDRGEVDTYTQQLEEMAHA